MVFTHPSSERFPSEFRFRLGGFDDAVMVL
jgi:hypothetical protein